MKILITSTSFIDTPGKHHDLINKYNFDVKYLRGPLSKEYLLDHIGYFDGIICGDDEIDKNVLIKGKKNKLKVISKYGVGLDKIDLNTAKKLKIKVTNCLGVNNISVAEHVIALLLSHQKNIRKLQNFLKEKKWKRLIGNEIFNKNIGILGLGNIGKEVAKRVLAFGMKVHSYDKIYDEAFIKNYKIKKYISIDKFFENIDYLSINLPLNKNTNSIINKKNIFSLKKDIVIINTSRGAIIDQKSLLEFLKINKNASYLTDVLFDEINYENDPLLDLDNVFVTPHVASRNYETVERQATMAIDNLTKSLL